MSSLTIVLACDEGYAMPLATTLRSACEHNSLHWPLQVKILTDHFSSSMRHRVAASLPEGAAELEWIDVNVDQFRTNTLMSHVSPMTFARLDIPALFAGKAERLLYLDADILVLGDLSPLWQADLGGGAIGAVADSWGDEMLTSGRAEKLGIQLPRTRRYFNAGVLLFDVKQSLSSRLTERAVDYLRANPSSPFADQDALNVACDGNWLVLDERWNFQGHDSCRIERLPQSARPMIVHFITSRKPWKASSTSYNARLYDRYRSRTLFRRSAPERVKDAVVATYYRLRSRAMRVAGAARNVGS